jgi:hypothetical protein
MDVKLSYEKQLVKMLEAVRVCGCSRIGGGGQLSSGEVVARPFSSSPRPFPPLTFPFHLRNSPPPPPLPLPPPQSKRENEKLESEVVALDSKARVIRAGVEGRTAAVRELAKVAAAVVDGGVGTVGAGARNA